jgi:hypothetical protein
MEKVCFFFPGPKFKICLVKILLHKACVSTSVLGILISYKAWKCFLDFKLQKYVRFWSGNQAEEVKGMAIYY